MSKRPKQEPDWFVSSFGGGAAPSESILEKSGPRKRPRKDAAPKFDPDSTWIDKYTPKTRTDLAVHKKKVEDVAKILDVDLGESLKSGGRIVLLTGPAGCGKTATVNAIANDLSLEVHEWINPVDRGVNPFNEEEKTWAGDTVFGERQSSSFRDFLFRSSRYSLVGRGRNQKPKILLVEDIPNAFARDPTELHEILRHYRLKTTSFCVFIVSDSNGKDSSVKKLFPPEVVKNLGIEVVHFNPVTTASLTRVLEAIATNEGHQYHNKRTLEALAESSGGDIRAAVNALQFACLKGCNNLERLFQSQLPVSGKKGTRKINQAQGEKEEILAAVGGRDATLFLFRILGKVLYAKRNTEQGLESPRLPRHLAVEERCSLQTVPELLVDKSSVPGSTLALFLHQNFPPFFQKLEDFSKAAEALSFADFIAGEWKESRPDIMEEYYGLVSVRGLMHANTAVSSGAWRALRRPKWFDAFKDLKRRESLLREEFCITSGLSSLDVVQDVLPFAKKLKVKFSPSAESLASELTNFKLQSVFEISRSSDVLDEVDIGDIGEEQEETYPVEMKTESGDSQESPRFQGEESFVIEDYDDV